MLGPGEFLQFQISSKLWLVRRARAILPSTVLVVVLRSGCFGPADAPGGSDYAAGLAGILSVP